MGMVEEWANLILECSHYISDYGTHQERCQFALYVTIPSRRVKGDAGLMTRMINHHSGATIQDLRGIYLNKAAIRTYRKQRLYVVASLRAATQTDQDRSSNSPTHARGSDAANRGRDGGNRRSICKRVFNLSGSGHVFNLGNVNTTGYDGTWPYDTRDDIESVAEVDIYRVGACEHGATSCLTHTALYRFSNSGDSVGRWVNLGIQSRRCAALACAPDCVKLKQ